MLAARRTLGNVKPGSAPVFKSFGFGNASSANNSLVVTTPTPLIPGDTWIAVIAFGGTTTFGWTPPSGWTLVKSDNNNAFTIGVYTHTAGVSEPASYTWTWSGFAGGKSGIIVDYTPCSLDGTPTVGQSVGLTSFFFPTITSSGTNRTWLAVGVTANGVTATAPSGFTTEAPYTGGTFGPTIVGYDTAPVGSGATGTTTSGAFVPAGSKPEAGISILLF